MPLGFLGVRGVARESSLLFQAGFLFESAFGDFAGRKALRDFEDEHVNRGMAVGVCSGPCTSCGFGG